EQLVYDEQQGAKPKPTGDIKTEYPLPENWGPRISEYRGDPTIRTGSTEKSSSKRANGVYQVSFNDAELSEVVRVILLDTLKIGYVLDPNVKGRVTLSSPERLTRDELLGLLETVLQMNRAAMIRNGGGYRIVPNATIRVGSGSRVDYATESGRVGPGYGITALPLRHVATSKMVRLLASYVAPPGRLRAEAAGNLLLIRGTSAERANLIDVARSFDVNWLRGQSAGIYRLLYAKPQKLIAELTNIFQSQQGGEREKLIRFEPIERLNGVLVLTEKQDLLEEAGMWIKRLDKASPIAGGFYVYRVEHAKASRLADIVNKMFSGDTGEGIAPEAEVTPSSTSAIARSPSSTTVLAGTSATTASGDSGTASLAADGEILQSAGTSVGKGGVRVVADDVQNKLLIAASLREYRKIVNLLGRLDQPAAQVLIKATLAEVQLNNNLRYGVQAFLEETNKLSSESGVLGFSNGTSLTIQPSFPGLNFIVGLPSTPKVILDALSNKTSVRLVSSPSVVVVNNSTAVIQVGDDVPIATRQAVSVTDPAAPIVNDIEFRKTGVILRVTPQINSDGLVTMEVEQENSSVASTTPGSLTPTISQRRIVSTISVYSGQMVVMGGLVSEQTNKFANRIPVLERVPVVGDAVGKTDDKGARTELVLFIQPRVIRDAADATRIADEIRARLGSLAPDDRRRRRVLKFDDDRHRLFDGSRGMSPAK
ncbi:MAG: type II secretion system secretin GspD, partial [Hyphomicrobiaceae bacterium]